MFCKCAVFYFLMTLQAAAIPNATKTPQGMAVTSYEFNDVPVVTACQFARRLHAATCLTDSGRFIDRFRSKGSGVPRGGQLSATKDNNKRFFACVAPPVMVVLLSKAWTTTLVFVSALPEILNALAVNNSELR
jgi:hypothetical protein